MLRTSLLLFPMIALAQAPAPPEVDRELRARVSGFYQNFVDESFSPRKAEPFVAEDTKDYFYNAQKQRYVSYHIGEITYSDNFTKAVVHVVAKMTKSIAGQSVIMDSPADTHWKIENGKWCWTYNPDVDQPVTPMSIVNPPPATAGSPAHNAGVMPKNSSPEAMRQAGVEVLNQQTMGIDKSNVTFNVGQPSSAEIVFTNGADGEIQISLDAPVVRGMKVKLDKTTIPGHGTAVLSLQYDPTDKTGPKDVWEPKGNIVFRLIALPFYRTYKVNLQFLDAK
jgi:hypothetical protein